MNTPTTFLTPFERELIIHASEANGQNAALKLEFPNPLNFLSIRKIFGNEKHKDIVIGFINDILEKTKSEKIVQVEFLDFSYCKDELNRNPKKFSPVDVLCTDGTGCQFIVQIGSFRLRQPSLEIFNKAIKNYALDTYIINIGCEGEKYEKIKEVYFIALLSENLMFEGEALFDDSPVHKGGKEDDCLFKIIYVEIPKFEKIFRQEDFKIEDTKSNTLRWGYLFKYFWQNTSRSNTRIAELCNSSDKIFNQAVNLLDNWTVEELHEYIKVEAEDLCQRTRDDEIYYMGWNARCKQEKYEALEAHDK